MNLGKLTVPALLGSLCVSLLALSAPACDMGVQEKLDGKRAERFKNAQAALLRLEEARKVRWAALAKDIDAQLTAWAKEKEEKKNKPEDVSAHPWLRWRFQAADLKLDVETQKVVIPEQDLRRSEMKQDGPHDFEEMLAGLQKAWKGTPMQDAARSADSFIKASKDFWKRARDEKFKRIGSSAARYTTFLKGYLAAAEEEAAEAAKIGNKEFVQRPFLTEAAFDIVFIHWGNRLAGTNVIPMWEMAFDFKAGTSKQVAFITKLCQESELREKCAGVPAELRQFAVQKPYLEWSKERAESFLKKHPEANEAFKKSFGEYVAMLDKSIEYINKNIGPLQEDPKNAFPETYSGRDSAGGVPFVITVENGAYYGDVQAAENLIEPLDEEGVKAFREKLAGKIAQAKEKGLSPIAYKAALLMAPRQMAGKALVQVLTGFDPADVSEFDLVGRRRADGSLQRKAILVFRRHGTEGSMRAYQFPGNLKHRCPYMGELGKKIGYKQMFTMVLDGEAVRVAPTKFVPDPEDPEEDPARKRQILAWDDPTLDTKTGKDEAKILEAIEGWASKAPERTLVHFFARDLFNYEQLMKFLTRLMWSCEDTTRKYGAKLDKTLTIKCDGTTAKERELRLHLSLCGDNSAVAAEEEAKKPE